MKDTLTPGPYNIGEAARLANVSPKMVRHYESLGLLPAVARTDSGYRQYTGREVHTLRFIRRARDLGFSIAEIAELLKLWQNQRRSSANVSEVVPVRPTPDPTTASDAGPDISSTASSPESFAIGPTVSEHPARTLSHAARSGPPTVVLTAISGDAEGFEPEGGGAPMKEFLLRLEGAFGD